MHKQFALGDPLPQIRQLCKLFIGPRGAITRMHQDNHHAHAWLCQLRGHKLYILCSPADSKHVDPRGSAAQDGGRTREGRLDPLDPADRAQAQRAGAKLYATVLRPGETILAPDGWWHYAVSLTPTITLMCNFWDEHNLGGLHGCFSSQVSRAFDEARKEVVAQEAAAGRGAGLPTAAAAQSSEEERFPAPVPFRVVHAPFIYLRAQPNTEASMLATARTGEVLLMGSRRDGWLRTSAPVPGGDDCGWALEDGAPLKLGVLLERV